MNAKAGWSPIEKALYVAGIPTLVLLAVLLFLGVAQSEKKHADTTNAQRVSATVDSPAARARKAVEAQRKAYSDCLKGMGVNFGGTRTRFSRMPDRNKIRTASGVCQTVMRNQGPPGSSAPEHAATPNTL